VCRPLLRLCRPSMIIDGCLDLNPECCRSKQARYRLSHPSLWLSHPSLYLATHPSKKKYSHVEGLHYTLSIKVSVHSSEWDPSIYTPSPPSKCTPPPPRNQRKGQPMVYIIHIWQHSLAGEGVGEPIRTTGEKATSHSGWKAVRVMGLGRYKFLECNCLCGRLEL
jgi:hypothetical protein